MAPPARWPARSECPERIARRWPRDPMCLGQPGIPRRSPAARPVPRARAVAPARRVPVARRRPGSERARRPGSYRSADLDGCARLGELLLDLVRLFLGDALLDG